ncbi:MAG: glycosyltransferase family 39 protein, partial [Anaerolineales bacterium]|nr:glycosyltransferase family 39 protein [Anaerolineales bacterium]
MIKSVLSRYRFALFVIGVYSILVVLMTWPLANYLSSNLPGGTTDTLVHYWNGWWAARSFESGQSPYYTNYLFYPRGIDLVFHNFAWWSIALWLVVKLLVDGIVAYNLVFLLNLLLCGLAMYFLARELVKTKWAAFVGGMVYMLWPARLAQLDHPNLISTHWIPLFVIFIIRTLNKRRWQDALIAGILLILIGYTRWQQLIAVAIVGGIYTLYEIVRVRLRIDQLLPLMFSVLLALGGLAPYIVMLVKQQQSSPAELIVSGEETTMQTDLLAYITPAAAHPVFYEWAEPAYDRYYEDRSNGRKFAAYLGVSTIFLAVFGLKNGWRKKISWLLMIYVFISLAMGPLLRFQGRMYPEIPMPYRLLEKAYLFRLMRVPDRYNVFLALPFSILASFGVSNLLEWTKRFNKPATAAWVLLIIGVILFEYLPGPAPLQNTIQSGFYESITNEDQFAILNLPIDSQKSKQYMFAQTKHGHPILQGKTARFPENTYSFFDGNPWLRTLRQYDEMTPQLPDVGDQLNILEDNGVEYIILHKTLASKDRLEHWQRYLMISPRYQDEWIAVYSTEPQENLDYRVKSEIVPGIGIIEVITSTNCLNPGAIWAADIGWIIKDSISSDYIVRVSLVSEKGIVVFSKQFKDGSDNNWPAGAIFWKYYSMQTPASLASGEYSIILDLIDAEKEESQ